MVVYLSESPLLGVSVLYMYMYIVMLWTAVDYDIFYILVCYRYVRRKRTGGYAKDELLEDELGTEGEIKTEGGSSPNKPSTSAANMSAFENPIYDSTTLTPAEVELIGYETKLFVLK